MPNSTIDYVTITTGMTKAVVEKLWNDAKTIASKEGKSDYGYIMGIFKKSLGDSNLAKLGWNVSESISLTYMINSLLDR